MVVVSVLCIVRVASRPISVLSPKRLGRRRCTEKQTFIFCVCVVDCCCCSVVPFGFFLLIHSYNILLVDDDDNKTILPNLHNKSDDDMTTEVHTIIRSVTKL